MLHVLLAAMAHADEPADSREKSPTTSTIPKHEHLPGVCLRASVRVSAAQQHVSRGEGGLVWRGCGGVRVKGKGLRGEGEGSAIQVKDLEA